MLCNLRWSTAPRYKAMKRALKPIQLFYYGLPGLPLAILGLPLFVYLPTFYGETLGLSLTSVGLALLIARLLDVITDPLIGILNDRFPKHWRRKSFMLAGAPILIIGLNFLLLPDEQPSVFYLFIWSFITYFGWTLINIPWLAWGSEITTNYHEKSSLASSREFFAIIGTVLVIGLPLLLSESFQMKRTLELIATIVTVVLPLALLAVVFGLREKQSVSKSPDTSRLVHDIKAIIKHPPIRKLLPAYIVNSFANALPATLFILFVSHVLKLPDLVPILLAIYFFSAIIGLPLWLRLAKKHDKHKAWGMALILSIVSFMWVPFLGANDLYAFVLICIFSGLALGADVILPASIQADITQDVANKNITSSQPSGLIFGLWSLFTKLALALAVGIAFPIIDASGLNNSASNPENTIALSLLYGLLPVLLKVWVLFQIWNFPFQKRFFEDRLLTTKHSQIGEHDEKYDTSSTIGNISAQSDYQRM